MCVRVFTCMYGYIKISMHTCMLVSVHLGAQMHICVLVHSVLHIWCLTCVCTNVHGYMNVHENIWASVSLSRCHPRTLPSA